MAEIQIKNINFDGNDLFDDSQGFMNDLSEDILDSVNGGMDNANNYIRRTVCIIPKTIDPRKSIPYCTPPTYPIR